MMNSGFLHRLAHISIRDRKLIYDLPLAPMASDDRHREDNVARSAENAGSAFAIDNRIPVVFAVTVATAVAY